MLKQLGVSIAKWKTLELQKKLLNCPAICIKRIYYEVELLIVMSEIVKSTAFFDHYSLLHIISLLQCSAFLFLGRRYRIEKQPQP